MSAWTCKACADRLGLGWGGRASADGGWCGAGQHTVPFGTRIEWSTHDDDVQPMRASTAQQAPSESATSDEPEQLGLL